jgi:hypothetical protein
MSTDSPFCILLSFFLHKLIFFDSEFAFRCPFFGSSLSRNSVSLESSQDVGDRILENGRSMFLGLSCLLRKSEVLSRVDDFLW